MLYFRITEFVSDQKFNFNVDPGTDQSLYW